MASLPPPSSAAATSSSFSDRRFADSISRRLFHLSTNKTTHLPCSSLQISAKALPSSSAQRNCNRRKPNALVLDAQARVCTGPTQTRPLDEEKAFEVLRTIVQSGEDLKHKVEKFHLTIEHPFLLFPNKTQVSCRVCNITHDFEMRRHILNLILIHHSFKAVFRQIQRSNLKAHIEGII